MRGKPLLVFLVSVAFRGVVALPSLLWPGRSLGSANLDTHEYHALATSIAQSFSYRINGIEWALRPPGYPGFLAPVLAFSHGDPRLAILLQILMGGAVAVMVFFWARRAGGPGAGLAAGLLAGLAPVGALFSGFLLTETLFTLLLVMGFVLFEKRPLSSGLCMGFSALVRPMGIYPALLMGLYFLLRRDWAKAGIFGLAFLLPVMPWLIKNKMVFGKAFLSTQHEATVYLYAAEETMMTEQGISYDQALSLLEDTLGARDLPATVNDPELAGEIAKRGIAYILRHPKPYAIAHLKGFVRGFFGLGRDFTSMLWGNGFPVLALVLFSWIYALLSYVLALKGSFRLGGMGLLVAGAVFLLLFLPGPDGSYRFRAPAEPLLGFLAAGAFGGTGPGRQAG